MKQIEATERHMVQAGTLAELGTEVDAFVRSVESPFIVSGISIEADIEHVGNMGQRFLRTSLQYSAVVTTTRGDLTP